MLPPVLIGIRLIVILLLRSVRLIAVAASFPVRVVAVHNPFDAVLHGRALMKIFRQPEF